MLDAVFISDIHLHPLRDDLHNKFIAFLAWAKDNTKSIYLLGDIFHACDGESQHHPWMQVYIPIFHALKQSNIQLYFMPGNRDFLLDDAYLDACSLVKLSDPTVIILGQQGVLLAHGDKYCTNDKLHMWFRWLTRNHVFIKFFRMLPYAVKSKLVMGVRNKSQSMRMKPQALLTVVDEAMLQDMQKYKTKVLIHGHIHQAQHREIKKGFEQYVLSDWDDELTFLCYDKTYGFKLKQFHEGK